MARSRWPCVAVGVAPSGEVVAAEVVVVGVFGEQVPADHEDRVADGDGCLLLADPTGETPVLDRQVGVAGPGGRPGALGEHVAESHVALGGPARLALAAGDVRSRCHPGHDARWAAVGNRAMSTPIAAMMVSVGPLPDSGDGVESVTGPLERDAGPAGVHREEGIDLAVELRDSRFEVGGADARRRQRACSGSLGARVRAGVALEVRGRRSGRVPAAPSMGTGCPRHAGLP